MTWRETAQGKSRRCHHDFVIWPKGKIGLGNRIDQRAVEVENRSTTPRKDHERRVPGLVPTAVFHCEGEKIGIGGPFRIGDVPAVLAVVGGTVHAHKHLTTSQKGNAALASPVCDLDGCRAVGRDNTNDT